MKKIVMFLLLTLSFTSHAAVYESVDENGVTVYSDTPSSNAKQLDIPQPQVIGTPEKTVLPSEEVDSVSSEESVSNEKKKPYTRFVLTSPVDQQTFQNQRDIPIEVSIEPKLQKGDKIQLLLDGLPHGEPVANTTLRLLQADRGAHQVSAALIDENQKVILQSNSVTVYIMYAHLGTPLRK